MNDEGDHRQRPKSFPCKPTRKIGQQSGDVTRSGPHSSAALRELRQELGHSSDGADAVPGHANYDGHFQNKLEQIGPENAPQTAQRDIDAGERHKKKNTNHQRFKIADAHGRADDVDHRLGDPAEDQAVHE